jgi:hypothetical protein
VSRELTHGRGSLALNRNAKTGLVLAAVALVFFAAIIAKYWLLR